MRNGNDLEIAFGSTNSIAYVHGICGKLAFDREAMVSPALVKAMADTIRHRGARR